MKHKYTGNQKVRCCKCLRKVSINNTTSNSKKVNQHKTVTTYVCIDTKNCNKKAGK